VHNRDHQRWRGPSAYIPVSETVDLVILDGQSHLALCWTADVEGVRTVVAVDLEPRWADDFMSSVANIASEEGTQKSGGGIGRLEARAQLLETRQLLPITSTLLRSLPVSAVLAARADHTQALAASLKPNALQASADWLANPESGELAGFLDHPSVTDRRKLDYLYDALAYVMALDLGLSPRKFISEQRNIELQTADRRIRLAREYGYLSPAAADQRKAAGELTDLGAALVRVLQPDKEDQDG